MSSFTLLHFPNLALVDNAENTEDCFHIKIKYLEYPFLLVSYSYNAMPR
ncbi:hypothetical protein HMPREF1042_0827 [Streptococcus constellatus subsp. pharyngis SK1060 = CCUG 46377]|uniref:Uncharacterized protein n=1 Tax=Streptococcus constellatus subsp. pharyngis SK1060 = CCUG 46377 TaxID=1035184 RepID=F9P5R9_STRCV|nr:hypothetical protein HMPREF1042_0827 [Streptococcus constellatus subsp. pharyngis SK1060 = CCUG 46377]